MMNYYKREQFLKCIYIPLLVFIAISLSQCNSKDEIDPKEIIVIPSDSVQYKYEVKKHLNYYVNDVKKTDKYKRERCILDICYPIDKKDFSTIVWIHGGGLIGGEMSIPQELVNRGFAIIAIEYRLSPKVKCPAYIEDAAAAVAWAVKNIKSFGGDSTQIYVAGSSAGAYLTMMIGMDKSWLAKYGIDSDQLAGYMPLSGQMITHFTIRAERGIPESEVVIDEFAPLFHVRANTPPILLFTGDRDLDMKNRYNENYDFYTQMKSLGNNNISLTEFKGYDHSTMSNAALPQVVLFVKEQEIKHQNIEEILEDK